MTKCLSVPLMRNRAKKDMGILTNDPAKAWIIFNRIAPQIARMGCKDGVGNMNLFTI